MHLVNNTYLDDDYIREIVRFAKPDDVQDVEVIVNHTNLDFSVHGKALSYQNGWVYGRDGKLHNGIIKIWIPKKSARFHTKFPFMRSTYFNHVDLLLDFDEAMVEIFAHEFYHIKQHLARKRGKRIRKGFNSRGRMSEKDTTRYATHTVRRWRKLHQPKDAIELLQDLLPTPQEPMLVISRFGIAPRQCRLCKHDIIRMKAHLRRAHPRVKLQRISNKALERYFK